MSKYRGKRVRRTQFAEVEGEGRTYWYIGRAAIEDVASLRLGRDISDAPYGAAGSPRVFIHNYLITSDYNDNDGGVATVNIATFRDEFDAWQSKLWWAVLGDYGTEGVAVRADLDDIAGDDTDEAQAAQAIVETLAALDSHPILDESAHSEFEMNLQQEQIGPALLDDNFPVRFFEALAEAGSTSAKAQLAVIDMDNTASAYIPAFEQVYWALGDLFSVYPSTEGSGRNISAVFYIDEWLRRFSEAVAWLNALAEETQSGGVAQALDLMVSDIVAVQTGQTGAESILDTGFRYGGVWYEMLRAGLNLSRASAEKRAVIVDSILESGLDLSSPRSYAKIRFNGLR